MPLNRRIVLEDSELNNIAPAPIRPEDYPFENWAYVGDVNDMNTWILPIHTAADVRLAIQWWRRADIPDRHKKEAKGKIIAAAEKFGVTVPASFNRRSYERPTNRESWELMGGPEELRSRNGTTIEQMREAHGNAMEGALRGIAEDFRSRMDVALRAALPNIQAIGELPFANTFNEFFTRIGAPELCNRVVSCKGCGTAGDFVADMDAKTIQCASCGRQATFDMFRREHQT